MVASIFTLEKKKNKRASRLMSLPLLDIEVSEGYSCDFLLYVQVRRRRSRFFDSPRRRAIESCSPRAYQVAGCARAAHSCIGSLVWRRWQERPPIAGSTVLWPRLPFALFLLLDSIDGFLNMNYDSYDRNHWNEVGKSDQIITPLIL
jgi:hypothetical protein